MAGQAGDKAGTRHKRADNADTQTGGKGAESVGGEAADSAATTRGQGEEGGHRGLAAAEGDNWTTPGHVRCGLVYCGQSTVLGENDSFGGRAYLWHLQIS